MKTWGEMSDDEQGALLLAHHRGEVIEWCPDGYWTKAYAFMDPYTYRVKKEPVVETRVQSGSIGIYSRGDFEDNSGCMMDIVVISDGIQCTYTDGKLTKIHWEADQ